MIRTQDFGEYFVAIKTFPDGVCTIFAQRLPSDLVRITIQHNDDRGEPYPMIVCFADQRPGRDFHHGSLWAAVYAWWYGQPSDPDNVAADV